MMHYYLLYNFLKSFFFIADPEKDQVEALTLLIDLLQFKLLMSLRI